MAGGMGREECKNEEADRRTLRRPIKQTSRRDNSNWGLEEDTKSHSMFHPIYQSVSLSVCPLLFLNLLCIFIRGYVTTLVVTDYIKKMCYQN